MSEDQLSHEGALKELERVWEMLHKERARTAALPAAVEIIPDDYPDWAKAAFNQGQFFNVVMERIKEQEAKIKELTNV